MIFRFKNKLLKGKQKDKEAQRLRLITRCNSFQNGGTYNHTTVWKAKQNYSATRFQKCMLSVRLFLSASSIKECEFNIKRKIPTASRFPGFSVLFLDSWLEGLFTRSACTYVRRHKPHLLVSFITSMGSWLPIIQSCSVYISIYTYSHETQKLYIISFEI